MRNTNYSTFSFCYKWSVFKLKVLNKVTKFNIYQIILLFSCSLNQSDFFLFTSFKFFIWMGYSFITNPQLERPGTFQGFTYLLWSKVSFLTCTFCFKAQETSLCKLGFLYLFWYWKVCSIYSTHVFYSISELPKILNHIFQPPPFTARIGTGS